MSKFYDKAWATITAETDRIDDKCTAIKSDPKTKRTLEKEFKKLKCRRAAVTGFTAPFYNSHRLYANNSEAHYMVPHIWDDLCADEKMWEIFNPLYQDADEDSRRDIALLFGLHAYGYKLMREKTQKLPSANERESIEIREYLSGYRFALDSIRSAWNDTYDIKIPWHSPFSAVFIESAMADAVDVMCNDCANRIAALPANAKNEMKALKIEQGMYQFCFNAGMLGRGGNRLELIGLKSKRMPGHMGRFPSLAKAFDEADEEEKLCLAAAFYGIVWMEDQPIPQYIREQEQAKASGDVRSDFEYRIKINAVTSVVKKWNELAECFGYAGLVEVPVGR